MRIDIKIKTDEQVSRFIDMMSSNRFVFKRRLMYVDMFSVYVGTATGLGSAGETERIIKMTELADAFGRNFNVTAVQHDEPDDMYTKKDPDSINDMLCSDSFRNELSGIGSLAARSYVTLDKICEMYRGMYLHEMNCMNPAMKPGYFLYASTVCSSNMCPLDNFARCFSNVYEPAMLLSKTSLGLYPEKYGINKYIIVSATNADCSYPHMFSRLSFYTAEGAMRCFRNHMSDWLRYFGVLPNETVDTGERKVPEKRGKSLEKRGNVPEKRGKKPVNKWIRGC